MGSSSTTWDNIMINIWFFDIDSQQISWPVPRSSLFQRDDVKRNWTLDTFLQFNGLILRKTCRNVCVSSREKNVAMKHSHFINTYLSMCHYFQIYVKQPKGIPLWATINHVMTSFQDFGNKRGSDVSLQTIGRPGSLAISGTDLLEVIPYIWPVFRAKFQGISPENIAKNMVR